MSVTCRVADESAAVVKDADELVAHAIWTGPAKEAGTAPPRLAAAPFSRRAALLLALVTALALLLGLLLGLLSNRVPITTIRPPPPSVYFTLVISRNSSLVPGKSKSLITVNGSVPGPTLRVSVGQTAIVTVVSQLEGEATAIHWHGIEQRLTPWSDGVPGTTQCPILVRSLMSQQPGSRAH